MKLWIVGQKPADGQWQFQGVFDSEEAAMAACRNETYWIAPATLNEFVPHEPVIWDGGYYPKHPDETRGRGFQG